MARTGELALRPSSWARSAGVWRQNHWFDALYNACTAGHGCGVRLVREIAPPTPPPPPPRREEDPDAVPWPYMSHEQRQRWINWKRWQLLRPRL